MENDKKNLDFSYLDNYGFRQQHLYQNRGYGGIEFPNDDWENDNPLFYEFFQKVVDFFIISIPRFFQRDALFYSSYLMYCIVSWVSSGVSIIFLQGMYDHVSLMSINGYSLNLLLFVFLELGVFFSIFISIILRKVSALLVIDTIFVLYLSLIIVFRIPMWNPLKSMF